MYPPSACPLLHAYTHTHKQSIYICCLDSVARSDMRAALWRHYTNLPTERPVSGEDCVTCFVCECESIDCSSWYPPPPFLLSSSLTSSLSLLLLVLLLSSPLPFPSFLYPPPPLPPPFPSSPLPPPFPSSPLPPIPLSPSPPTVPFPLLLLLPSHLLPSHLLPSHLLPSLV